MIPERLKHLRNEMQTRGIDMYVVPTSDFHESEYVGDYFKARKFITGFSGSAGTALITMTEAGLWTDGRYFIQAERELSGTGVDLYRMGQEGVPTITEFLAAKLPEKGCIGFDGRVMNTKLGKSFAKIAGQKNGSLKVGEDLVDIIWKERPELPAKPTFVLEEKYSGEAFPSKLERVRQVMREEGAQVHIMSCLYDIAWFFNMRGGDVDSVPVFLSFVLVTMDDVTVYLNEKVLTDETKTYLEKNQVKVRPYNAINEDVKNLPDDATVLLNEAQVNYSIFANLPMGVTVIDKANPAENMKSCKNEVEIQNTINAHIKDGVAFTKFMYWVKNNVGKMPMTEVTAADYLYECRKAQENFLGVSFGTICAYGPNAAMMHYSATLENCATLEPRGMLLIDSGGHYYEGSTDITRTVALGPISDIEKKHFTAVCRSCFNLSNARFLYGCTGQNLDILARGPIWDMDLDYQCGTGHGVGYLLNIHEGPNGFRWKIVPERKDSGVLEEGHITTDEPGIYLEGQYGIRLENELVCRKGVKNEYGQFMYFDNITVAPIDLDCIDVNEMLPIDKKRLNEYHKRVYEILSPYMTDEENKWLKEYTREI